MPGVGQALAHLAGGDAGGEALLQRGFVAEQLGQPHHQAEVVSLLRERQLAA